MEPQSVVGIKINFTELVLFSLASLINPEANPPKKDQKALFVYNIKSPGEGGPEKGPGWAGKLEFSLKL